MPALRFALVTFLGGYRGLSSRPAQVRLVIDRSGLTVREGFRRSLKVGWPDLRGLEIRPVGIEDHILVVVAGDPVSVRLHTDDGVIRLHLAGSTPADLRATLASWVVEEAGPDRPLPATPPPAPRVVRGEVGIVEHALGLWRANSLGREPVYDRSTLAYRLAVARNHALTGNHAEAVALLEALAAEAARSFGPTDDDTLKVRNELGQTYLAAGAVDDGLEVLRELVVVVEQLHGPDADLVLVFRNNLAVGYMTAGQYPLALDLHEENVRHSARRHGPASVQTVGRRNNLASALALAGQRQRAIQEYWDVYDALPDAEHRLAVTARQNLAILHNPSWKPDGPGASGVEAGRR